MLASLWILEERMSLEQINEEQKDVVDETTSLWLMVCSWDAVWCEPKIDDELKDTSKSIPCSTNTTTFSEKHASFTIWYTVMAPLSHAFHNVFHSLFVNSSLGTMNWLSMRHKSMAISRGSRWSWVLGLISFLFLKPAYIKWNQNNLSRPVVKERWTSPMKHIDRVFLAFWIHQASEPSLHCGILYNCDNVI